MYFGSEESNRQIMEVAEAFEQAHELGMATVLWCYTRNNAFKTADKDYHVAADLTGQANHLGVTMGADIIKQKLPENNGGFTDPEVWQNLPGHVRKAQHRPPHRPDPLPGAELLLPAALASSTPAAKAWRHGDRKQAMRTAIVNKRAGGQGLISGRKAFQRPFAEGVELLHAIQDVYLDERITLA